ncbi:unnamed protein product [Amoebophrya sp. A25]|nr:unnamed protein product [Amoebophrya sp. A25]|eukprot:GSA25T00014522001.1
MRRGCACMYHLFLEILRVSILHGLKGRGSPTLEGGAHFLCIKFSTRFFRAFFQAFYYCSSSIVL